MNQLKYDVHIASGRRKLVEITDFSLSENKITFLFGESGIGKSIISKAIYGLLDPEELRIKINNKLYENYLQSAEMKDIQANGFFVFQEPSTHLNPLLSLQTQLSEGSLQDVSSADELSILKYLWKGSDPDFLKRLLKVFPKPYRPSGGEKQRILLVMAFKKIKKYLDDNKCNSALFVFDEPSGSLDNTYRDLFIQLLLECYKQKPFTSIIITHDYSVISMIERNYQNLSGGIEYKELARQNDSIRLSTFSKDAYLGWIKTQSVGRANAAYDNQPVVRLKSGVRIFGKTLSFHQGNQKAQPGLMELKKGELIYLKAQSGVGKTTIAKIIMGLINADNMEMAFGKYLVKQDTRESFWRKVIWGKLGSMIFQHADEALNQNATVWEIFKALPNHGKKSRSEVLKIVQELFDIKLNGSFLDKKIKFLSGGQKQRINILRTITLGTELLIMDEPLNGLDLKSAHKVIEKIKQHQAAGKAVLLISHNEEIFDRIVKQENVYYLKAV